MKGGLCFGDCPDLIHLHRGLYWQVYVADGTVAYNILHWGGEPHIHITDYVAILVVHEHSDPLTAAQRRVRLYLERCSLQVPGYLHTLLYSSRQFAICGHRTIDAVPTYYRRIINAL
eukprot:sb/3476513/